MLCFFIFNKKIDFFLYFYVYFKQYKTMSTSQTYKWSYRQTLAMKKADLEQEKKKLEYEKLSSEEQQRLESEWATEKAHREKHKHNELHNAHEKQVVPVLTKLLRINELLHEAKKLAESYDEAIDCESYYNDSLTPDSRWLLRSQCLTLVNSLYWTLNDCDNARNTLRDTPIEFQFYPSGDSL
jgi:hypothetical protein